ncbi:MAG: pseudaminic acid cytidylyltransferase [Helicobacter sp.]|nr:pseudaminic acid cytidylyltransferase [Helicobacter sp.]
MKIAIIPARGNSKRIKDKNILDFFGKPFLVRAIELAKGSKIFDEIYVSSDSAKILDLAQNAGAKVLLRQEHLANDFATTLSVMKDACLKLGIKARDIVCCLYPATPLLKSKSLQDALELLEQNATKNYVFSCVKFRHSPFRSFSLKDNIFSQMLIDGFIDARSQDLGDLFYDAGAFYFGWGESFLKEEAIFAHKSLCYLLNDFEACDINTKEDLEEARAKFAWLNFH